MGAGSELHLRMIVWFEKPGAEHILEEIGGGSERGRAAKG